MEETKKRIKKLLNPIRDEGKKYVVLQDEITFAGQVIPDKCLKVYLIMKRMAMDFGAGDEAEFHIPLVKIAEKADKPLSSIQDIVKKLIEIGLIRKEQRPRRKELYGKFNIYYLVEVEEWWERKGKYLDQRNVLSKKSKIEDVIKEAPENEEKIDQLPDFR